MKKKLSFKQFVKKEKGEYIFEAIDLVASPATPNAYLLSKEEDAYITYTQYLSKQLTDTINYSEYLSAQIDKSLKYSDYVAENLYAVEPKKKIYEKRKRVIKKLLK
jgi:hypothetical protein